MLEVVGLVALCACGASLGTTELESPPDRFHAGSGDGSPITVEDAIRMVRLQIGYRQHDPFIAFSPDGSRFATVVWRGDLEQDVNHFSLLVIDVAEALANPRSVPEPVLSIPYEGDAADQDATPIAQLTFLPDNRTVLFLGTLAGEPHQVYSVDTGTGAVRPLTRHPAPVAAYAAADDGRLRFYAAVVPDEGDTSRVNRIRHDGVSPYDRSLFPDPTRDVAARTVLSGMRQGEARQYFQPPARSGDPPRLIFDSRRSRRTTRSVWEVASDTVLGAVPHGNLASEATLDGLASMAADPTGRYVVMWPYILGDHPIDDLPHDAWSWTNLYGRSLAAFHGLVDLEAGTIGPLLDVLVVPFIVRSGGAHWAPDGRSVLLKTLLPLDATTPAENQERTAAPATWLEVQVPSRSHARVPIPDDASVVRWDETGDIIIRRVNSLAALRKEDGVWSDPRPLGDVAGFNALHPTATNGRVVVGVQDSLTVPPELAAFDLEDRTATVLTNLNPQLYHRTYGDVELLRIRTGRDTAATAWLVKPLGFEEGRRYPLVVLFLNSVAQEWDRSYLIDGRHNLSGHAAQSLAAAGFMVLCIGQPPATRPFMGTPEEGEVVRVTVEAAIDSLVAMGRVDPARVGISGWSRFGYYVGHILVHSRFPFAAAVKIDGGAQEYNDRMRPYTDAELDNIRTPLLLQPHGVRALVGMGAMADRMRAIGKAVDILYFHDAPHSTKQPRHRQRALQAHIDWWRFWLQDHDDPAPEKQQQYQRWRELRPGTGPGS